MSDDPCGALCGMILPVCTVACIEICAACTTDFTTYRHTSLERQGTKSWWCFGRDKDIQEESEDREDLPPERSERQPLLEGSQPQAKPAMAASTASTAAPID